MKYLLASLALLTSTASFAEGAKIKSLKVSFQDAQTEGDVLVTLEGVAVGLQCQEALTKPVVRLIEEDRDMYVWGVEFTSKLPGVISRFVCLDTTTTVDRAFKTTLKMDASYTLYNSFIDGTDLLPQDDDLGLPSSLQAIRDAATCGHASIPALEGGLFGVGPVMPEVCVFETTAK